MSTYKEVELRELIEKKVNRYYKGANLFNANGDFISKVKKGSKKRLKSSGIIGKAKDYVEDSTKQELADKKIEHYKTVEMNNIDALIQTQSTKFGSVPENKSYYFKEFIPEIAKAREKQEIIRLKGLNNFSLPRLVFMQFKKNCKAKLIETVRNTADKVYDKMDEIAENRVYAEIMKLFGRKIKVTEEGNKISREIEELKKKNPRAYKRATNDLAEIHTIKEDDDFIVEVTHTSLR